MSVPALKWFEKTFAYDQSFADRPAILARLEAALPAVSLAVSGAEGGLLTTRFEGKWSAQENIGHFLDMEPLWIRRLQDALSGQPRLTEADLKNTKTELAGHNDRPLAAILEGFRLVRAEFLALLGSLDAGDLAKTSIHPRLGVPMNGLNIAYLVAEHDDHHLQRIRHILDSGTRSPRRTG